MTSGYAFLRTMVQTRSKGHTATGAVCYRLALAATSTLAGRDGGERAFDYTRRSGIASTGWAAPAETDGSWSDPITWAHRIEAVDKRKNSRQCRDDVVGIPVELVEAGLAEEAVQAYADRLAEMHRTVVHFAVHEPARGGSNWHAHVLYPGRRVEGLGFSKHRDREQDNPKDRHAPDLVARHKTVWSEVCRDRGIELRWSNETPGHHLGPQVCATKRRRLVTETRDAIQKTIAASQIGGPAPGRRTLDDVAVIASRVNDGLTVTRMLQMEQRQTQEGQPEPRAVAAPAPYRPEVLPPTLAVPEVSPPVKRAPQILPPVRQRPQVLPPVRRTPEALPPVHERPGVLPPVRLAPEVPPPARRAPEVLPPTKITPRVLPPIRRAPEIVQPMFKQPNGTRRWRAVVGSAEQEYPDESSSTWRAVGDRLRRRPGRKRFRWHGPRPRNSARAPAVGNRPVRLLCPKPPNPAGSECSRTGFWTVPAACSSDSI